MNYVVSGKCCETKADYVKQLLQTAETVAVIAVENDSSEYETVDGCTVIDPRDCRDSVDFREAVAGAIRNGCDRFVVEDADALMENYLDVYEKIGDTGKAIIVLDDFRTIPAMRFKNAPRVIHLQ